MDDLLLIDWHTRALATAGKEADWEKIAQLDSDIAALLSTLQHQPLIEPKRAALQKLQRVHQQVLQLGQQHSQALQQKMTQLHHQREGAQAYAAYMEDERDE